MRHNSLRALLTSGAPTLGTHVYLASPTVVELIGHMQIFDYVEFQADSTSHSVADLEHLCRAAELHSLGTITKVDFNDHRVAAQRAVGAGFEGVLFADPESREDVVHCVSSVRPTTPEGRGSFGVWARRHALPDFAGTPEYVSSINEVVVGVMIEKPEAIDRLDDILKVGNIDFVQWGPADYSMSIGQPGEWRSEGSRGVERHVIDSALAAGLRPRAEIDTVDEVKYYANLGVRDFCLGSDLSAIGAVLRQEGEHLRETLIQEVST